ERRARPRHLRAAARRRGRRRTGQLPDDGSARATVTGMPDWRVIPLRRSASPLAVSRETLGSAKPCGIDTVPDRSSPLRQATPVTDPWALDTVTRSPERTRSEEHTSELQS